MLKEHLRCKTRDQFKDYYALRYGYNLMDDSGGISPEDDMCAMDGITYPEECFYVRGCFTDFCTMVVYAFPGGGFLVGDELQGSCSHCHGRIFPGQERINYEEWLDKMNEFIESLVWFTDRNDVKQYVTSRGYARKPDDVSDHEAETESTRPRN